ncbi:hypothetical protein C2S53_019501 [Perilla frutescens var. hirtella]|uniref:MATH domain-containing protein n=1 Tax=Perilla frutescens var. hirtella TaxID=608512 RepID=A0AAD4JK71_PERFH|nr:hypothetical protein C2S53_019501 [Perilla frutescens var. hirtella]
MAEMFPVDNEEFSMEISDAPPADLLIKIQRFSKLWMHGVEKHESSSFLAGNYKWKLIIYPNGRECKNDGDHISVYLSVADTDSLPAGWEISANLSIFLHNQISDNYFCFRGKARRFDAKNLKWGFSMSKRMLTEASNGFLVDDKCSFGAEVFLRQTHAIIECLSLLDWKISDFLQTKRKMKLYPNGNKSAKGKCVSIFLECAELKSCVLQQKVKAHLIIRIKNKLPQHHVAKSSSHWFTSRESDWGFTHFIRIADMCDPSKGFIINDCCFLETQISVLDVVYAPKQVKGLAD